MKCVDATSSYTPQNDFFRGGWHFWDSILTYYTKTISFEKLPWKSVVWFSPQYIKEEYLFSALHKLSQITICKNVETLCDKNGFTYFYDSQIANLSQKNI